MNKPNQNFQISGGANNIQAGRDILYNPVINVINVSYSDVKTFEKVLKSIPPENFINDILLPWVENHPEVKIDYLAALEGIMHKQ